MIRLGSLFIVPFATLLLFPSGALAQDTQEVDCRSICLAQPDSVPPECVCETVLGGGSAAVNPADYADPEVAALHQKVRETWIEETAGVDNYTVVRTSSVTPMPEVMHYEKIFIDGYPAFRNVAITELANMQQREEGEPTAGDLGGAVAAVMGTQGGSVADAMAAAMGGGGSGGDASEAPDNALAQALAGMMGGENSGETMALHDMLLNLDSEAVGETHEDVAARLFYEDAFWKHGTIRSERSCEEEMRVGNQSVYLGPNPMISDRVATFDCIVVGVDRGDFIGSNEDTGRTEWTNGEAYDRLNQLIGEAGGGDYLLDWAEIGIRRNNVDGTYRSILSFMVLCERSSEEPQRWCQYDDDLGPTGRVIIGTYDADFNATREGSFEETFTGNTSSRAAFVPWRQENIMGLLGVTDDDVQNTIDQIHRVLYFVQKIMVNEGPPTQEQVAKWIAEYMEAYPGQGGN